MVLVVANRTPLSQFLLDVIPDDFDQLPSLSLAEFVNAVHQILDTVEIIPADD
jgi:hypothetical protein